MPFSTHGAKILFHACNDNGGPEFGRGGFVLFSSHSWVTMVVVEVMSWLLVEEQHR